MVARVEVIELVELIDRIVLGDSGAETRVRYHFVLADYVCRVTGGEVQAGSDAADVRWVTRADIAAGEFGVAELAREVIEKAFQKVEQERQS
jgi:8-oxo-dGTP diphosphatase